jgi:hypothetical protein
MVMSRKIIDIFVKTNHMNYEAAIDLQKQLAFIAALLSGFSITFLIGLLQLNPEGKGRLLRNALVLVAFSVCSLIISTITSMSGAYWLTERPHFAQMKTTISSPEINAAFDWSAISFVAGLIALLVVIGISGKFHSRRLGRLTMAFSIITISLILYFWIFLVNVN